MVDHHGAMKLAAKKAVKAATDKYQADHPDALRLDVKADVWVFGKKPKGYSNHRVEIVQMFLVSGLYLRQTNAQIAALLSEKYAPHKIPGNVLTRPIPPGARKKIEALLKAAGKDIDLKTNDTLSKIKGALLGRSVAAASVRVYDARIAFTDDAVVIGDKRFPVAVHKKGYGRVRMNKNWLRSDVLEALIKAGS